LPCYLTSRFELGVVSVVLAWPACSPDLSPIEMVWAILEYELSKRSYSSVEEKRDEVIRLWNSFPIEMCHKLIDTFDYRIRWVAENKGYPYSMNKSKSEATKLKYTWENLDGENLEIKFIYNDNVLITLKDRHLKQLKAKIKHMKSYFNRYHDKRYSEKTIKKMRKLKSQDYINNHIQRGVADMIDFNNKFIKPHEQDIEDILGIHNIKAYATILNEKQLNYAANLRPKFRLVQRCQGELSTAYDENPDEDSYLDEEESVRKARIEKSIKAMIRHSAQLHAKRKKEGGIDYDQERSEHSYNPDIRQESSYLDSQEMSEASEVKKRVRLGKRIFKMSTQGIKGLPKSKSQP
jgi:hypothetical protein